MTTKYEVRYHNRNKNTDTLVQEFYIQGNAQQFLESIPDTESIEIDGLVLEKYKNGWALLMEDRVNWYSYSYRTIDPNNGHFYIQEIETPELELHIVVSVTELKVIEYHKEKSSYNVWAWFNERDFTDVHGLHEYLVFANQMMADTNRKTTIEFAKFKLS